MKRPEPSEYGEYYRPYVSSVPPGDIVEILEAQGRKSALFLAKIDEHTSRYRYAESKWSIREVICHLTDAERIFLNRAVRFARNDTTPLPGFDENAYVADSGADALSLVALAEDFRNVRAASVSFFRLITDDQSLRSGIACDNPFSVRSLAYIIVGHEIHHMNVIRDRYLA